MTPTLRIAPGAAPLALLVLAAAGCARTRAETPVGNEPTAVRTAAVRAERIAPPVTATGVLAPKEEVALSFKVGGVVARVPVDEGRTVRAGDTLAALDLREIDAAVTRARAAVEKVDRDLARTRRLYADSVATLEQLQNAQTGMDLARAELETATFNRRYAVIVAPSGGVILRRAAEAGELVQAGVPIITLGSRARGVVLRVGLADRDVVRIARGDPAVVRFDALPDRVFRGSVTEIAAAADAATGTYGTEVTVPGAAGLSSGLVGQVEIRPSARDVFTLVPVDALLEADGDRATVFTVSADGRRAVRRTVQIAFLAGDSVAVSGLDGVRSVVTDGAAYLNDGDAVRVQP